MDDGLRFAIREGGRTVGAGVVAKFWANYTLISFELKGRFGALLHLLTAYIIRTVRTNNLFIFKISFNLIF